MKKGVLDNTKSSVQEPNFNFTSHSLSLFISKYLSFPVFFPTTMVGKHPKQFVHQNSYRVVNFSRKLVTFGGTRWMPILSWLCSHRTNICIYLVKPVIQLTTDAFSLKTFWKKNLKRKISRFFKDVVGSESLRLPNKVFFVMMSHGRTWTDWHNLFLYVFLSVPRYLVHACAIT